jgi:branched-chain amino acid transport system substrate-binding protein
MPELSGFPERTAWAGRCVRPVAAALAICVLAAACATAPVAAPATGAQPAIKAGANMPLTGAVSGFGATINTAFQLGVEDLNQAGGIAGRKLDVVTEDNQSDPKSAAAALRKQVTVDRAQVMISPFTNLAAAQIPVANEFKTPILFTSGVETLSEQSEWAFNLFPSARKHAETTAQFAMNTLGYRRFAAAQANADQSVVAQEAFDATVKLLGGEVLTVERYDVNNADFRTIIAKIQAVQPDAVFVNGAGGKDAGLLLKQMAEAGYRPKLLSYGPIVEAADTLAIGGEAVEGVIYSGVQLDMNHRATASYVERFKARMEGKAPDFASSLYYDMPFMLAEAARGRTPDAEGFRAGLIDLRDFSGVTGKLSAYLPNRTAEWQNVILVIKGGKPVPYGP